MGAPIRIYLVESCRIFADSLASVLGKEANVEVLGATAEPAQLLRVLDAVRPDVVLLSAGLEAPDAQQVTREVKDIRPDQPVVLFGVPDCEATILRLIEAGVSGYALKDTSLQELLHTIELVHEGRALCSPRVASMVFSRLWKLARARPHLGPDACAELSFREHEVLGLMADGLLNKEIARRLGLSLYTVKNHVHHILEKLRVGRRYEAIRRAYERGLLRRPLPDGRQAADPKPRHEARAF
jgi:DNA-binding NarL/FixJ family response regulator